MRGIGRLAAAAPTKQTFLSTTTPSSSYAFSTFPGRGRGRGLPPPSTTTAPGKPQPDPVAEDDALLPPALGHGRGRGRGLTPPPPPRPSSSILPSSSSSSSSSFMSPGVPAGRGRGRAIPSAPPPPPGSEPEKPVFSRTPVPAGDAVSPPPPPDRPLNFSFGPPGAGRGKETKQADSLAKPPVDNRHVRQRPDAAPRRGRGGRASARMGRGGGRNMGVETAENGSGSGRGRGFAGERGGRGRGGRETYARGGRGGRFGRLRPRAEDEVKGLYLGDNADGERLTKRLGEEEAQKLQEVLDEASYGALPCPMEDAYKDAVRLNYRIEFEPEYLMEFNKNPDIDEKPPIPLREALEKMKPFLMEYEGIESEEDWEEAIKDVMGKAPALKSMVDEYGGPDVITAKQQHEELERVAKTIPENVPSSVKRFTDRAFLSLQNNPGWGFDKKKIFMDSLASQMSQHYK